jgi:uncharacterized protein
MKRLVAIILCVFPFCMAALAQETDKNPDPASREQILFMLDAMQSRKTIATMMDTMQKQVFELQNQELERRFPDAPPQMRAEISAATRDMLKDMEPLMSELVDDMVPVYQKHLSRQEADAITAFYLSPEGKSFLNKMPEIMSDSMSAVMKSLKAKMQSITERMDKRMQDIAKKYAPKSDAEQDQTTPAN